MHLSWDEFDLASYLRAGQNVIAVLARNCGVRTQYYKPPMPVGHLGFGGLLLEARLE